MSTLKVDSIVGQSKPLPIIKDSAVAIETFTPTVGHAVYTITNPDIVTDSAIIIYRNNEVITGTWTAENEVTLDQPEVVLGTDFIHICMNKYSPFINELLSCETKEDVKTLLDIV